MPTQNLKKLLNKVARCANFEMLFCLEEEFNSVGLTLQPTKQNKMILCIIEGGAPSAQRIFEDYIHLGSLENRSNEISRRLLECIKEFAISKASKSSIVSTIGRSWQNSQTSFYGNFTTAGAESYAPQIKDQTEDTSNIEADKQSGIKPKCGYWSNAIIAVTNISENIDKTNLTKKEVLIEDIVKEMSTTAAANISENIDKTNLTKKEVLIENIVKKIGKSLEDTDNFIKKEVLIEDIAKKMDKSLED